MCPSAPRSRLPRITVSVCGVTFDSQGREQTIDFVRRQTAELEKGASITFALEHEGRASGLIGLDGIQWQLLAWRVDRAELGYWLARRLGGQGLMTEAAQAVVRFGFETLGLHKVTVGCFAENAGSRRVIEKCGFRFVGRHEHDAFRQGRWWDTLRYELIRA
jgi:RimJ/RimL family protein N-acetyltransferase